MKKEISSIKRAMIIDKLDSEAARFTDLAKDLALSLLHTMNPESSDKVRLAREHLIRAESYRSAARLVGDYL